MDFANDDRFPVSHSLPTATFSENLLKVPKRVSNINSHPHQVSSETISGAVASPRKIQEEEERFTCQQCQKLLILQADLTELSRSRTCLKKGDETGNTNNTQNNNNHNNNNNQDLNEFELFNSGELKELRKVVEGIETLPEHGSLRVKSASFDNATEQLKLIFNSATMRSAFNDFPLCRDCTLKVLKVFHTELNELEEKKEVYQNCLKQLQEEDPLLGEEDLEKEIQQLEQDCQLQEDEINQIRIKRLTLAEEYDHLQQESLLLEELQESHWKTFLQYSSNFQEFEEKVKSITTKIENARHIREGLITSHILNDSYRIWFDGPFGIINNFKLGRLPNFPVDGSEINAAWGYCASLLHGIAQSLNFSFSNYAIHPNGNFSHIERLSEGTQLELYGTSDISLGRLFFQKKFDTGMQAFLDCLGEICVFAVQTDKNFSIPYPIQNHKIGDLSIKVSFNDDEAWTKALKFMLTDLKWLLAWTISRESLGAQLHPLVKRLEASNNRRANDQDDSYGSSRSLKKFSDHQQKSGPPAEEKGRSFLKFFGIW